GNSPGNHSDCLANCRYRLDIANAQQWDPDIKPNEREIIRRDIFTLEAAIKKHTPPKQKFLGFDIG
ncbi:MAG: hypothetical protein U9N14_04340, partial [Pseudomonadota bacterium]|nr:hypothetical protein [Pseudomonadota bacterium]